MKQHLLRRISAVIAGALTISSGIALAGAPAVSAAPVTAAIDTSSEASVRNAYLNPFLPTQSVPVDWSGSVTGCVAGDPSPAAQDAIITAVNYMRAMAGQPAVTENTAESANTQQAALMMQATNTLAHDRDSTWTCYTPDGAKKVPISGSGGEIIASVGTAQAIPLYVLDPGDGNQAMGHRAAVLSAQAGQIGSGSTANFNDIHWIYNAGTSQSSYSWPSAGYFPYELINSSATRWSFYPQTGDAAGASVTVTKNGAPIAVTSTYKVDNAVNQFNETSGLGWTMPTITAPAGGVDTYHVTISGGTGSAANYSYDVLVFNAAEITMTSATISGTPKVGAQLTASVQGLSPSDASVAYVWKRGDTQVGAGATYTPTAADLNATLTVTATATKTAFSSATQTSAPSAAVQPGTLTTATPTITGTAAVGQTLSADTAGWGPSGVALTNQWYADGVAIPGATGSTLALTPDQLGKKIKVQVDATLAGYTDASAASAEVGPVALGTLTTAKPTIPGTPEVDEPLTGVPGDWGPSGVALTYQWFVAGQPVNDATTTTYTPTQADMGKAITFQVTGTLTGYTPATLISASTAGTAGNLDAATPTITGAAQVAKPLAATAGTWTPSNTALAYQWNASGEPIPGANGTTYTPAPGDLGKQITVTVTGTLAGYAPDEATSAPTAAVAPGEMSAGTPSITGSTMVGQVLSADPGTWTPADTALSYRWYADGEQIPGATAATLRLTNAQEGAQIRLTVTGTAAGYSTTAASALTEGLVAPAPAPLQKPPDQTPTPPNAADQNAAADANQTASDQSETQTATGTNATVDRPVLKAVTPASTQAGGSVAPSSEGSPATAAIVLAGLALLALAQLRRQRQELGALN